MTRSLFIIAGAALVLCLACLGGAAALGSRDLARNDWTWVITDEHAGDGSFNFRRGKESPTVTRNLAWSGQSLTIDLPVNVTYVQGDTPGVVVSGPEAAVDRVKLANGRLSLTGHDDERAYMRFGRNGIHVWSETEVLEITVTAPDVNSFRIAGSGDLLLEDYDQPNLGVVIDGSGDVEGTGRTGKLDLRVNGSGDVDLDGFQITDAVIEIAGSGDVSAGPEGEVRVDLSGSGDMRFTRRPRSLQQEVSGSGEVSGS